jgi:hypothetical protein
MMPMTAPIGRVAALIRPNIKADRTADSKSISALTPKGLGINE